MEPLKNATPGTTVTFPAYVGLPQQPCVVLSQSRVTNTVKTSWRTVVDIGPQDNATSAVELDGEIHCHIGEPVHPGPEASDGEPSDSAQCCDGEGNVDLPDVDPTDGMSTPELLAYLGTDGMKWATSFLHHQVRVEAHGDNPHDVGWVTGWFANAIETARNVGADQARHLAADQIEDMAKNYSGQGRGILAAAAARVLGA